MNIYNFSTMWEKNLIVKWFRAQNFKKGTYLLAEGELARKLNMGKVTINHGLNYLWSTSELLKDEKGWYVEEGKVKYVENEGWYLRGKLIFKA